jgi:hypothetical protein
MRAQEWAEQSRPGAALWWIVIALIATASVLRRRRLELLL